MGKTGIGSVCAGSLVLVGLLAFNLAGQKVSTVLAGQQVSFVEYLPDIQNAGETPTSTGTVSLTETPTVPPTPSPIPSIFWTWTTTATVTPAPTETITRTPTPLPASCADVQSLFWVELQSNAHYVAGADHIAEDSNVTWWITVTGDHDSVDVSWGWENGQPMVISTPTTVASNGTFQFTMPLTANVSVVIDNPAPIGVQYDSNVQVSQQICVNMWPPGWVPTATPTMTAWIR